MEHLLGRASQPLGFGQADWKRHSRLRAWARQILRSDHDYFPEQLHGAVLKTTMKHSKKGAWMMIFLSEMPMFSDSALVSRG